MKIYLAPMEGNTGYVYRRAIHDCFGGFDKYFIPFITPNQHGVLSAREIKDIVPEHNAGIYAVPQIMTKYANEFIDTAKMLHDEYGYDEVNLNLGCPSKTVVSKGRGAGFLEYPDKLEKFLDEIFEKCDIKISIKTRLGMSEAWEFTDLLEIYNRFPLEELIIHPRVQKDYYNNLPNLEAFSKGLNNSKNAVCYNGNIFSIADYEKITAQFPELDCIMLGRGAMANPALAREIRGGVSLQMSELREFHDMLYHGYCEELSGDKTILFKMKEFWSYVLPSLTNDKKVAKKIKKSERLIDYEAAVNEVFYCK